MTIKPKEQLDRIEKKLDKLNKKLDNHIREIWSVYEPIKKILEKFGLVEFFTNYMYLQEKK